MIKERLASSIGRRDEEPNIELAQEIVQKEDNQSISELIKLMNSKQKELQNDSIKVLYEIGELSPALIENYFGEFVEALKSKNNRLQWGAMTAIKTISKIKPLEISENILTLEQAVEQGSVITRDNYIAILVNFLDIPELQEHSFNSLINQLKECPTNQLPMYAEMALPKIRKNNFSPFSTAIANRLDEIEKVSKRKRLEKVLKKLGRI